MATKGKIVLEKLMESFSNESFKLRDEENISDFLLGIRILISNKLKSINDYQEIFIDKTIKIVNPNEIIGENEN